jgi:hypothetical protein
MDPKLETKINNFIRANWHTKSLEYIASRINDRNKLKGEDRFDAMRVECYGRLLGLKKDAKNTGWSATEIAIVASFKVLDLTLIVTALAAKGFIRTPFAVRYVWYKLRKDKKSDK